MEIFLGLYGDLVVANKRHSWDLVQRVMALHHGSWLIKKDLNEVTKNKEVSDKRTRDLFFLESFRHLLEDCELADLGFKGANFTWRRSSSSKSVDERLDRCLANPD